MKKTTITFLTAGLLFISGVKAQTIQEGMNHLYAGRIKNASNVFEQLLAVNPNDINATYWLGQTQLESDEIMNSRLSGARRIYEKGIQSTNGAPLLQVGLGHVELLEGKTNEARQHFETALTMTANKKGNDPVIATAIGRAITDSKTGDFKYAVKLLEDAATKDPKNTETLLQLGNAYRKAGEGSGGGAAFTTYKKALEANPGFAVASLRLAQLFESQKNWEQVTAYLNEATTKDAKFTAAYYELFYYNFYRSKFTEAEDYLKKYIDSKLPVTDIQDQFLYAQLCWARKDFACATSKAEGVIAAMGEKTKPKVYRLLADAQYQKGVAEKAKGDSVTAATTFANAKKFSDLFFAKKNPEDYISNDHKLRADIMSQTGGTPEEIYNNYVQGVELDTTVTDKVDFLKKGITYFKDKKVYDKQALLLEKIITLKPTPTINDYFDLMYAYYNNDMNSKSREKALLMREKFPDQVFGYDWAFRNAVILDTVKRDSIAVPDALILYAFAEKDTVKFKKEYINSVKYLAGYYINTAKNKEKAIEFFTKWKDADTANAEKIQGYIDQIRKAPAPKPAASKGTGKAKVPTPKKPVTTKSKTAVTTNTGG
ncbi:MAG TPA: tetratricopeptide repeat protein [Chitinophagaceae bacterium]|nr:tetratricopeptide repeat protein [Chitinophagaceae bacterium]